MARRTPRNPRKISLTLHFTRSAAVPNRVAVLLARWSLSGRRVRLLYTTLPNRSLSFPAAAAPRPRMPQWNSVWGWSRGPAAGESREANHYGGYNHLILKMGLSCGADWVGADISCRVNGAPAWAAGMIIIGPPRLAGGKI